MSTYAYIDAANLFYGGKHSLGWSIDYLKLYEYLKQKYQTKKTYFFGGVETLHFPFNYLESDSVPIATLENYLHKKLTEEHSQKILLHPSKTEHYLRRARFYKKLESFGYTLVLKPVKSFSTDDGTVIRKANCDVDLTFSLMRDHTQYTRAIVLSGDGDFLPVLKFLRYEDNKDIQVLAHAQRTAREIKQFAAEKFLDFGYLRKQLEHKSKET